MTYLLIAIASFVVGALIAWLWARNRAVQAPAATVAQPNDAQVERESAARRSQAVHDAAQQRRESQVAGMQIERLQNACDDYKAENATLKEVLRSNIVLLRQVRLDRDTQAEEIRRNAERAEELAAEYLKQTEQVVSRSLNAKNYAASRKKLIEAVEWCREIGFQVSAEREAQLLQDLKRDFEEEVRKQLEREEQARIRAQIREEQAREREIQKELDRIERERAVVAAALEKALATATDQHSAEIEELRSRLAEAESRQRAVSQAELTKAGHIYVISNLGSFGEDVYKIGMTRRLEPDDRINELGDASVPFPFDVHMMISCENAPKLESEIHKHFQKHRVNRVNPRKEFFRVDFDELRRFVEQHHGTVHFTATAAADEYRQSVNMSEEDQVYIETVFDRAERQIGAPGEADE